MFLIVTCILIALIFLLIAIRETRIELHKRHVESNQQLSILVFIHGDAKQLQECLKSIHASEYTHFDIVVIDQYRYDLAKNYKKILRSGEYYYRPQKVMSFQKQIIAAHHRSKKGDAIVIHSNIRMNKQTLIGCAKSTSLNSSNATYFMPATTDSYSFSSLVTIVSEAVKRLYAQLESLFGRQKSLQRRFDYGYVIPKKHIHHRFTSATFEHSIRASHTSDTFSMKYSSRIVIRFLWISIATVTLYILSKEHFSLALASLWSVVSGVTVFQVLQGSDNSFNQKITVVLSISFIPAILVASYVFGSLRSESKTQA